MAADHNDLLRILRATNFADHVGGRNGPVANAILHVDFQPYRLAAIDVALNLFLIFGGHADHGNVVVGVKSERAGMGKVHSFRFSAALPANHGYRACLMSRFQEVAEFCEH